MDTKKFLTAAVAGGITLFVVGGLIYGIALNEYIDANIVADIPEEPVWWSLILSQLTMGGFLAFLLGKWAGITSFADGATAGTIVGLFLGVGLGFDLASVGMMTFEFAAVDTFLWAIRYGVAGGVVGLVLGKG